MRKHFRMGLVLSLLLVAAGPAAAAPLTIYVAPDGNDAWSGRLERPNADKSDGPVATLERARDAIREVKRQGGPLADGIVVELAAGRYERDKLFELSAEDSGTVEAPIVYRARPGDVVKLSGSRVVTGWKPVSDPATVKRLAPAAQGKVFQVDLKAQGIADCGDLGGGFGKPSKLHVEVFCDDVPMPISRWPNEGFIKITELLGATPREVRGTKGCAEGRFRCEDEHVKRWAGEKDVWVLGYWFRDWAEERQRVKSIDAEQGIIELEKPYHNYGYRKGQWFYGYNILPEIDQPGEWCVDREAGVLYFWPPADLAKARVEVSLSAGLVSMDKTAHVTLRGLLLEGTRGTAVTIKGGESVRVVGCTFRNLGVHAVASGDGKDVGVVGCDMYGMGGGGIMLGGGDLKTLKPAGNFAENNHIHHYSRWDRMYRPGIVLSGVGNRISRNLIHNAPHMAIGFGGNDHLIELNEIHSVCYESNDCGAIYAGRNWTSRGHVLRHNFLHHVYGHEGRGCVGIYLDDMFSSATIYGNVFYNVMRAAFIGGGRDNTVENNIFVDCPRAMHIDCRALGWAAPTADRWIEEAKTKGTISGIRYREPPYGTRFPRLASILDDDPKAPCGNVVRRNIFWLGDGSDVRRAGKGAEPKDTWWDSIAEKIKPLVAFEENLVNVDPHFKGTPPKSFVLADDSPAWKLGFQPIPLRKIGLYQDADRASWPATHTVRPMPETLP